MTFAEYNTDENFDNNKSTADELIQLASKEGVKKEDLQLSPKWAEDKSGNVKNAIEKYYGAPKELPKAEENTALKTDTVKPLPTMTETDTKIDSRDKNFADSQNSIADYQENKETTKQTKKEGSRWNTTLDRVAKSQNGFSNIEDSYLQSLPNFMIKDFLDDKFGDHTTKDAKIRLGYFLINGLQSQLKNASNVMSVTAGHSPMFSDTTSDYEKIRQTNLQQGLENRWNKNKQSTQTAIDLLKQEGMDEQDIQSTIAKVSANSRLQSALNMMNDEEKAYTLTVMSKLGERLNEMDSDELLNLLSAYAIFGDTVTWQEAAEIAAAKFLQNDEVKEKGKNLLDGLSGGMKGATGEENSDDPYGAFMSGDEYKQYADEVNNLYDKFTKGEISEEDYRKQYSDLLKITENHPWATKGKIVPLEESVANGLKQQVLNTKTDKKTTDKELLDAVETFRANPELYQVLTKYPVTKGKWNTTDEEKASISFWNNPENLQKYGFKNKNEVEKALKKVTVINKNPKTKEFIFKE